MMFKALFTSFLLIFLCVDVFACRFWCAVGEDTPKALVAKQLIEDSDSLKELGATYEDGWSVGYYADGKAVITRSSGSSKEEDDFDKAVHANSAHSANIQFSHLRRASSGCVEGVPNPHPFERQFADKHWIFGHNGGMKKQILIDLIQEDFLSSNSPNTCTDNAPQSWIDSELYFIFLLKHIEANDMQVEIGLTKALAALYQVIPNKKRKLNFFLSDGNSLWVFRKGNTLFYHEDNSTTIVASSIPDPSTKDWSVFPEDKLARLTPGEPINFF
ncbi:MAG: putative glutamine amidotransferase [Candidatus Omnitrophota bacterium]|jgi:predicted glutamine amidotransferase